MNISNLELSNDLTHWHRCINDNGIDLWVRKNGLPKLKQLFSVENFINVLRLD